MLPKIIMMTKAFTAAALKNPFVWIPMALSALYIFREEIVYFAKIGIKQLNILGIKGQIIFNKNHYNLISF